ncbi:MAG: PspC domain-containing protein [Cyclobacteriaceae bacterium]
MPENKRLVRDKRRKVLGGVCAGLAHYFGIDIVWPRLLFALLTLGYGGGILIYIVLWIALPTDENLEEQASVKKMFRDPERKVLGGVAGGIAAFFAIDLVLVRILFVISIFLGGFGLILYLILWFSIPEAKTITEKMEMQGEPVTLSNIESSVKKSLNEKGEDESTLAKIVLFPFRALAAVFTFIAKMVGPIIRVFVDVIRVMIGVSILLVGVGLVIAVLISFGVLFGMISTSSLPDTLGTNIEGVNLPIEALKSTFSTWTVIAAFFAALIPALFVQFIGSSIVAKRIVIRPVVGWSMFGVFVASALILGVSLPRIILSFKEEGEFKVEKTFDLNGKTQIFKINEVGLDDYPQVHLSINGYDGKQIKLTERFMAQGRSRKRAIENAQTVSYNAEQNDSTITFDSNITFNKDAQFSAQRLDMEMLIPYDQPFVIDENMWRLIDNQVRWSYSETDKPQTWKFTKENFECISCPALPKSEQGLGDTDQFGFKDFEELDIKGVFNLEIRQSDKYSVEIDAPESERKKYKVDLAGNVLEINYDSRNAFWKRDIDSDILTKIILTMPNLKNLKVKGAGKIRIEGFNEDNVDISMLGALSCEANLSTRNLQLDLSGPIAFELDGHGDFLEAEVSNMAQLKASGYEVGTAVVVARELGRARVNARDRVEIEADVTGSVKYQGSPEVIKRD